MTQPSMDHVKTQTKFAGWLTIVVVGVLAVAWAFAPTPGSPVGQAAAPFGGNPNKRLSIYDGTLLVDGTASARIGNAGRDIETSGRLYLRPNSSNRGSFVEGAPDAIGQRLELTGGLNGQQTLSATWTGTAGQSETQGAVQGHFHGALNNAVGAAVYGEVNGCGAGLTCYAGYFSGGSGQGVGVSNSGTAVPVGEPAWSELESETNNWVMSAIVYNGELIVGGYFTQAGSVPANRIARWDGSGWSALGSGLTNCGTGDANTAVNAMTIYDGDLIVGGCFENAGGGAARNIAKWNGSSWSALGAGTGPDVSALAVFDSRLIVGGDFTMAGGVARNSLAQWDGSVWSSLAGWSVGAGTQVNALTVYNNQLYVGGINLAGQDNDVLQWNGSQFLALGSGTHGGDVNMGVYALTVYAGKLVAGGNFVNAGDEIYSPMVATWDGSDWAATGFDGAVGSGSLVRTLAVAGGFLYAGGYFWDATAPPAPGDAIARWDGSTWSAVGGGIGVQYNSWVAAITGSPGGVYVGGMFTTAGGNPANNIAFWGSELAFAPTVKAVNNDPAGLAALFDGSFSAGRWDMSGNVRGTCDWVATPPNELVCPDGRLLSGVQSDCPVDSCITSMYCCEL